MKRLVSLSAVLFLVAAAQAQEGIVANGIGTEIIVPDRLELELRLDASADLSDDALVKYRDANRRLLAAFDELKLEHLHIEQKGIAIGQEPSREAVDAMMRGMTPPLGGRQRFEVSSVILVRLDGIAKLSTEQVLQTAGKLLETAQDNGAVPFLDEQAMRRGSEGVVNSVRFTIDDFKQAREAAYRKAVEDARHQAGRLAKLSGVELGSLLGVQQGSLETEATEYRYTASGNTLWFPAPSIQGDRITSDSCTPFPLRMRVTARFAIRPAAATASK